MTKPRLGVFKFSSCDGCQLSILDLEEELLTLVDSIDICDFLEASSDSKGGPYDIALVEGSVSTPEEVERIRKIREESIVLVTIGACATAGDCRRCATGTAWIGSRRQSIPGQSS